MDIQTLASRPNVNGTAIDTPTRSLATTRANASNTDLNATDVSTIDAPATTAQLSTGGLIMGLMQVYESQHPAQAQAFLQGIADKLHTDAQYAGAFAPSLSAWGDAFQRAADTGDLSNLLPSTPPASHFGIRAYQAAQQPTDGADAIAAVLRSSLPPVANDTTIGDLNTATGQLLDTVNQSIRALGTLTTPSVDPAPDLIDDVAATQNTLQPNAIDNTNLDPTLADQNTLQTTPSTLTPDTIFNTGPDDVLESIANDAVANLSDTTNTAALTPLQPSALTALQSDAALDAGIVSSSLAASNLAAAQALGITNPLTPTLTVPSLIVPSLAVPTVAPTVAVPTVTPVIVTPPDSTSSS